MKQYFIYASLALLCWSCQDSTIINENETLPSVSSTKQIEENLINVKFTKEIISQIDNNKNQLTLPTGNVELDNYLSSIGAEKATRTFPYAGKHEATQKEEGLNLWYTITLNRTKNAVTRALNNKKNSNITQVVEPVYTPKLEDYTVVEASTSNTRSSLDAPFDDPYWPLQWDLYNKGNIGNYTDTDGKKIISSIKDADINVINAWQQTKGNPNVIVSVVDGGVDIEHEDLKDNLWVNEGEIPDNGIDDDNNGYIDDVNGYNFVDNKGTIVPQDHGTHVAGTIAAKNNNKKGICGIAGGDGTPNSGARIMVCQIFKPNPNYNPNLPNSHRDLSTRDATVTAAAIVYGANNGALISQNSWGYDSEVKKEPQVIRDAIDYFIKYAGSKPNSLMKGGIVFFAAGNSGSEEKEYPGANENVIAVAAAAPDYTAAWYSNYGNWVDILAPGGSSPDNKRYPLQSGKPTSEILSTLPSKNNVSKYGYLQGTSMACPHMSGIAALAISKFGSDSFTAEELKQRILSGVKPIDLRDYNENKYTNKLGMGYADAALTLEEFDMNTPASTPQFLTSETQSSYTSIQLGLTSNSITSDNTFRYRIYYSTQPIVSVDNSTSNVSYRDIPAYYNTSNNKLKVTIDELQPGTKYYFAVKTFARNGKASNLVVYNGSIATLVNTTPEIIANKNVSEPFEVAGKDTLRLTFKIIDKENHSFTYEISKRSFIDIEQKKEEATVIVWSEKMFEGKNSFIITAKDELGALRTLEVFFIKKQDKAPTLNAFARNIYLEKGEEKTIPLISFIIDEDPQSVQIEIKNQQHNSVKASIKDQVLTLKGQQFGESTLSLLLTDKHNQTSSVDITPYVYMNKGILSLFPTIANKNVYIKLGDKIQDNVKIEIRNSANKMVFEQSYNTSTINSSQNTLHINTSSFAPGRYQVVLKANNQQYQEYFFKQ